MEQQNKAKLNKFSWRAHPLLERSSNSYDKIKYLLDKHFKIVTAIGMLALFAGGAIAGDLINKHNEEKINESDIQSTNPIKDLEPETAHQEEGENKSFKDIINRNEDPTSFPLIEL